MKQVHCEEALLPSGWAHNVLLNIDENGAFAAISSDQPAPADAERVSGIAIPGVPNCHSHAFQRAITGLTERRGQGKDNFWSWRNAMYQALSGIGPEELQGLAEQLYLELLSHGYTRVAEFHYLHHAPGGPPYSDPAEMSRRLIQAARNVGIGLTLLPVLYCRRGFDANPVESGQQRFAHSMDRYLQLLAELQAECAADPNLSLGIAPHSLRAVTPGELADCVTALESLPSSAPFHIHIAEQQREVEECVHHRGARPVRWLLDNVAVDSRWCLVHATHMDAGEVADLAASGAIAGLCPTTEANLGDGLFPAPDYLAQGGTIAIGSDSQVGVSPAEELRLLEYGQRLVHQGRAVLASEQHPDVGSYLLQSVLAGGANAAGSVGGALTVGASADLVVLDSEHPSLSGRRAATALNSWIFSSQGNPVRHVMQGGQWRIRDYQHREQAHISERFNRIQRQLLNR